MIQLINKTEVIDDLKKDIVESDNCLAIAIYLALTVRIMSYKNIDAVDVVRCKDCKFQGHIQRCPFGRKAMPPANGYCCYGERRER